MNTQADKTGIENFLAKHQKNILFYTLLFFGVIAYIVYQQFYSHPEEEQALDEMYYAKQYFERDSLDLALNGDGQNYGFLDIIKEYKGTDAENMSRYFAGIIYYKKSEYQKSIELIKDFEADDMSLSATKLGMIGNAYSQMGNYPKAHEYYQKASQTKNPLLCPIYLKKAGIAAMELKKYKEATAYFSRVKKEFPKDLSAENIDSYIQLAKSLQN